MIDSRVRAEVRETIALAIPAVVTQLGLALMSLTDSLIVGPLGPVALGGVGLGNSTFFTVTLFALGMIMALDPLIAQAFGAGDRARCGELFWQGTWLAVALAVPFTLVFLDFATPLRLLGQPPEVVAAASAYLRGRALNVPTMLLFGAQRGFLNGVGDTRAVMVVVLLANVVNAVVSYALVHGALGLAPLGVYGAGLGSSIAGVFMAVGLAAAIFGGRYRAFEVGPVAPRLREIAAIARFGLPIAGQIVAEVGVFNATFIVMGQLGDAALAAHQIALQLASTTFMVPIGVSIAASIRVGQAIGRGAPDDAARAGRVAYALGIGFMATSALGFALFPAPLARLFTDDAAVVALAVTLIRIAALFQLSDGAQAVGAGCLRGAGDSRTAFVVNLLAHWGVGFPLGYALGVKLHLGAAGLWYGLTASLTAVAVLLAARFASGGWRRGAAIVGPAPPFHA
jgi:MATE family multidrug resistance protein